MLCNAAERSLEYGNFPFLGFPLPHFATAFVSMAVEKSHGQWIR